MSLEATKTEPYSIPVASPPRIIRGIVGFIWPNAQVIFTESGAVAYLRGGEMIPGLEKGHEVELEMRDGKVGRGWISRKAAAL